MTTTMALGANLCAIGAIIGLGAVVAWSWAFATAPKGRAPSGPIAAARLAALAAQDEARAQLRSVKLSSLEALGWACWLASEGRDAQAIEMTARAHVVLAEARATLAPIADGVPPAQGWQALAIVRGF